MLLVDADQAEPGQRREDRRARPDHDRRRAGGDALALVAALGLGQRRVEDRHPVAEPRAKAADRLRRERDLGDEDDHAQPALERLGRPPGGRPRSSRCRSRRRAGSGPPSSKRLAQPLQRTLLRLGQRARLRLARQRVPLGRLRELLAPLPLRRRDERERTAGRRAVVVGEPRARARRAARAATRRRARSARPRPRPAASPRARSRPRAAERRRAGPRRRPRARRRRAPRT